MSSAESTEPEGSGSAPVGAVVAASLARVLGVEASLLRADSPLASLGWDSLARVCLVDVLAHDGWACNTLATAHTVGDLADGCAPTSARGMS
jgi:hypothetical protein